MALISLQSRRFLTKTRRYIDRGRHLEKQRKRLRGRGTSPLKSLFDSSQLSGSINVQDGRTTSFLKTIHGSCSKTHLLCRLGTCHQSHLFLPHQFLFFGASIVVPNFYASVPAYVRLCLCSFLCESLYSFAKSFKALMLCIRLLAPLALLVNLLLDRFFVISRIIKVEVSVTS